ncbi:unnamed protein product, partial [Effrenium voratum]
MARLRDIEGCRSRQRVDQCMHGACDENRIPIMKPTGLQANIRASDAKEDIAITPNFKDQTTSAGHEDYHIYYKCDKCRLGREAPPGTEHSLVPRECRHASSLPTPGTSSAKVSRNVTTTLPDLMEQFKREAMRHPTIHDIKLTMDYEMPAIDTLMLKLLFLKVVEEGVNIIEAHKQKYRHWTEDPVYLAIARKIFKKVLDVKGICCTLHDDEIPVPMPYLRTASAPLRLVFKGDVKCWTALTLEDIRTLSQPRTKIMHDGWLIAIFGSAPNDQDHWEIDEAAGILRRHHVKAPLYDKAGSKLVISDTWTRRDSYRHLMGEDRWTGVTEFKVVQEKADEEETTDPVQRLAEESEKQQAQEEEEDTTMDIAEGDSDQGVIRAPMKPLYDFRRVLHRLPRLAEHDHLQAERLLLGLHERFWHAGVGDMTNLLIRAGMPKSVIGMISKSVAQCKVCNRFTRLPNRPQVKTGHVTTFNQEIQVDFFFLWENTFMLIIDVATRYKTAVRVTSRELRPTLRTLMTNWFRWFGPPRTITCDQESCLMSHEAGAEMERLNIRRNPSGTTKGTASSQKTATGLVEKHVDLTKLVMLKTKAELERQVAEVDYGDIAMEAAMAQNLTLNLGGYTPHMCVTGALPFPFYDVDSVGLQSVHGTTDQMAISVYEQALRLRQAALTAATQSIMESRLVRAGRTRPQQVPVGELKPGISEVEFHREGMDDFGWRGPATLLKIGDGNAIIEYQGKPYLIPLRCLRHFRGVFFVDELEDQQKEMDSWKALRRIMKYVENLSPYKEHTLGYIHHHNKWIQMPRDMVNSERENLLSDIQTASKFVTDDQCHGMRAGVGLKKLNTPGNTQGVLICWPKNTNRLTFLENPNSKTMIVKKLSSMHRDDVCMLYLYHYGDKQLEEEPRSQQPPHQPQPPASMDVDNQGAGRADKRSGTDTRTVTFGPEAKKQKYAYTDYGDRVQEAFLSMHQRRWETQLPAEEPSGDEASPCTTTTNPPQRETPNYTTEHTLTATNLFTMHGTNADKYYADIRKGGIFRVDTSTDSIHEDQVYGIWDQVDAADKKEVSQFLQEKAFKKVKRSDLGKDAILIDAIWVRKWKKQEASRVVKSRLCARGCHDPFKQEMSNSSTKNYAQEGVVILLMADNINMEKEHYVADDSFAQNQLSGRAQLVYASSNKAKRISYSTSHGETLAAINGLENATLLSARFSEITTGGNKPSIHDLLAVQEHGARHFPVDAATDCRDVFELTTGHRSLPQDKSQRLYILAHREARAAGRLRWFVLLPTECMTADSLAKVMQCPNMMELLTTGRVKFFNTGHSIEMKRLPPQTSVSEEDLLEGDNAIIRNTEKAIKELYAHFGWVCAATAFGFSNKKPLARAVFFASMLTQTAAHKTEDAEDWIMGYFMILATMGVIAITLMLEWSSTIGKGAITLMAQQPMSHVAIASATVVRSHASFVSPALQLLLQSSPAMLSVDAEIGCLEVEILNSDMNSWEPCLEPFAAAVQVTSSPDGSSGLGCLVVQVAKFAREGQPAGRLVSETIAGSDMVAWVVRSCWASGARYRVVNICEFPLELEFHGSSMLTVQPTGSLWEPLDDWVLPSGPSIRLRLPQGEFSQPLLLESTGFVSIPGSGAVAEILVRASQRLLFLAPILCLHNKIAAQQIRRCKR